MSSAPFPCARKAKDGSFRIRSAALPTVNSLFRTNSDALDEASIVTVGANNVQASYHGAMGMI
jgi:hypothetical protein